MSGPGGVMLGLIALASGALATGGVWLLATGGDRRKGVLMLVAAMVFAGNVLVWTV